MTSAAAGAVPTRRPDDGEIAAARRRLTDVVSAARAVPGTAPAALRGSVEELVGALEAMADCLGLPVIEASDEPRWSLVEPLSAALRQGRDVLAQRRRSARQLGQARQQLLAAAVAAGDPAAAHAARSRYRHVVLPIVVPGPDGQIPAGLIDCDIEAGTRIVRWYPKGWSREGELFAQVAGRPGGFRYRWQERQVWDQLALDLIIVCCGWRAAPTLLPPVLARSQTLLGNQLRRDLATGTWALQPSAIATFLERNNVIVVDSIEPPA